MNPLKSLFNVMLPSQKPKPTGIPTGGSALTGSWNPANPFAISAPPTYQDHLRDIFVDRQRYDTRVLMRQLAHSDPDVSSAFNAYLTMANTQMIAITKDMNGHVDPAAMVKLNQTIIALTRALDYTKGFQYRPNVETISESLRYMLLMRGACAAELVFDENTTPVEVRHVDTASIYWWEQTPGQYKPEQRLAGIIKELDFPSFFMAFHHRDPTMIYPESSFISVINVAAARQQVINDLYRIMQTNGYPRISVKVIEEVLGKAAPAQIQQDPLLLRQWKAQQLSSINSSISNIRPDQAFVHFDSVEPGMINEKASAMTLDIQPVIDVLNGQNQAALKTMATIIGRGDSGVNTASVEANLFTMNCNELNQPVSEIWSAMLTLAMRVQGYAGFVDCHFEPAELRPKTELENQYTMRSARLKEDLSLGLITDMEYHLQVYGRIPPEGAPKLMGTGFMLPQTTSGAADGAASPANSDPMGKSLAPKKAGSAKDAKVKKAP